MDKIKNDVFELKKKFQKILNIKEEMITTKILLWGDNDYQITIFFNNVSVNEKNETIYPYFRYELVTYKEKLYYFKIKQLKTKEKVIEKKEIENSNLNLYQ